MLAWCSGIQAAQAVNKSTAGHAAALEPAIDEQQLHSDAESVPQPRFAAQSQPEQPVASKSQEAKEATGLAADSTAEAAASGGGGRYQSVPPSSLWGAPVGVGVPTSSAGDVKTGAGQPAAGVGQTPETALVNSSDDATLGTNNLARDSKQTGYGRPSNRPATHTGFAPGMRLA